MFRKLGVPVERVATREAVLEAKRLVLPGVGAFDHGMKALEDRQLDRALIDAAGSGIPVLGICLGMQLLGESSEEGGKRGLGLIRGGCVKFVSTVECPIKVPHMGWNSVHHERACTLFAGEEREWRFYFTHSYHFVCSPGDVVATAFHGAQFTAAIQNRNVFGVQFHPEKSHRFGMDLLRNFEESTC